MGAVHTRPGAFMQGRWAASKPVVFFLFKPTRIDRSSAWIDCPAQRRRFLSYVGRHVYCYRWSVAAKHIDLVHCGIGDVDISCRTVDGDSALSR